MIAESHIISKRIGRNVFETPPRISVVIPAYNAAKFIGETLDSAVEQKFREHEIIVVNDGSPDTEALERTLHTRLEDIVYIKQRNLGAGPARNTAIEHARGDIIAFLDSDDLWLPEYLATQLVYLERHGLDMVYCDAYLFGMNNAYRRTFMETAPSEGEANFESILSLKCNVITSGTMARKKSIVEAGNFEVEKVRAHDFHLWLRMARNGAHIGYQRKPLLKYRVHADNISGDSISRVEREIEAFERVKRTIELTAEQRNAVALRIAGLKADLAVEHGKTFLLRGEHREAATAFRSANRHRRSVKLAAASFLASVAPSTLVRLIQKHRSEELALIRR